MMAQLFEQIYSSLARPVLFAMEAERAHKATIAALNVLPLPTPVTVDPCLKVAAFGLDFPNPLGMAPGFDKSAQAIDAVLGLGFGFTEIGTVTPLPQPGNPLPRLVRLVEDRAVINRFGFNSEGIAPVLARLRARQPRGGIVGVNIGANKDATDRVADYVTLIRELAGVASYVTVNVSSPNTPGLRSLQQADVLDDLLVRVIDARDQLKAARPMPVLLKIAPDLDLSDLDDIVRVARARHVDGMIVANTTIARPDTLLSKHAKESGGLSGAPLRYVSTKMLAQTYLRVEGQFPLIGVGGIDGADAAFEKVIAGASLFQLYSAMVFQGPALVRDILEGLPKRIRQAGYSTLHQAVGTRAAEWAARAL